MERDKHELDELAREISRTIMENKKFLARVMDDDFEPDEEVGDDDEVSAEL